MGVQGTGGSTAVANSWMQLRKAGAAARAMLVKAAAASWGAAEDQISVSDGRITGPAGQESGFGAFAEAAARLDVPQNPALKDPSAFKLIGKTAPRLDSKEKSTGKTVYSLDIRREGQLTAMVVHAPKYGGTVKGFDATAAKAVPGVVDVVQIPTGVAVLATGTWAAMKGREALSVEWDFTNAETRSSDAMIAGYRDLAASATAVAASRGDAAAALASAKTVLEAEFDFPYLAHACMEPMNGTIALNADGTADVWAGCQLQTVEQQVVAAILGTAPEKTNLHTIWAGGSFGRRATPNADYLAECAHIVKAINGRAPVHLVWTREDDMRSGYFRPQFYHKARLALGEDGRIAAWEHVIAGKSIIKGSPFEAFLFKDGVDATSVEGTADTPYAVPAFSVKTVNAEEGTPVLWWRSVGHTHTAQVMEALIDEAAEKAGKDPVQFRLDHLPGDSREAGVLKLVAEKAGWTGAKGEGGKGRGVSVHESFGSFVAMIADVTISGTDLKVDRIIAAVDVGVAVNPDIVRSQVEGAVGFALSSVTRNRITLKDGEVQETNLVDFEPTRMREMPVVEVHILPSDKAPTGIGEPGVPTLAPAITNAIANATGKRLRSLPLDLTKLGGA
jgi:isoquinoline 1-oxidoreductase beta subunit